MFRYFKDLETNKVYEVPLNAIALERKVGEYKSNVKYKSGDDYSSSNNLRVNLNNKFVNVRLSKRSGSINSYLSEKLEDKGAYFECGVMFKNLNYKVNIDNVMELHIYSGRRELTNLPNIYTDGRVCWGTYSIPNKNDVNNAINYFFNMVFNRDLNNTNFVSNQSVVESIKQGMIAKLGEDYWEGFKQSGLYNRSDNTLTLNSLECLVVASFSNVYVDLIL